jgi:hypothetical protein
MRRLMALALIGSSSVASAALLACTGDDTNSPLPVTSADASASDATTASVDSSLGAPDAGADDSGVCALVDAGPLDEASVAIGRALVVQLKCQSCHGELLQGNINGVKASYGMAYPPNLTSEATTGLGCWTNAEIEGAILNGLDNEGQPLCAPMPLFADKGVDASSAASIVSFLRSLPPVVSDIPDTVCPAVVDAGDAGPPDAGPPDAGPPDAGPPDAGAQDGGSDAAPDAPSDASGNDAGDATAPDGDADDDAGE